MIAPSIAKVAGIPHVSQNYAVATRTLIMAMLMLMLGLGGCSGWRSTEEQVETLGVAEVYDLGRSAMENGNYDRATRIYKRLVARFPFGEFTEQAQLDLAFVQSKLGDADEATASVNRFIKTYPTHPRADYAFYLRGLIGMEQQNTLVDRLVPEDRGTHDQSINKQAFLDFSEMLKRFPESSYAGDARARMVVLRATLAEHEMGVARYYLRRGAFVGAINRAKVVVENYQETEASYDALAIMIEGYKQLGQDKLAMDTEAVLKLNKPEHPYFTGASKGGRWYLFGN
jgi:outer membrane protein assembly factor BamD